MLKKLINEYEFNKAGKIYLEENNEVNYLIDLPEFKSPKGQVYAWVIRDKVVYIGMAGKGVDKRHKEHRGGWRGGSKTGVNKAKLLRDSLNNNQMVAIYARTSDVLAQQAVKLLGKKTKLDINLNRYEEHELIRTIVIQSGIALIFINSYHIKSYLYRKTNERMVYAKLSIT